MWCNGSTLAQNVRDVGSIPALGTIFPISVTPTPIRSYDLHLNNQPIKYMFRMQLKKEIALLILPYYNF